MNIVSGFISGVNGRSDRDLTKYVALGKELMSCEIPMTIFLEKSVFQAHFVKWIGSETGRGEFVHKCEGGVLDGMRYKYYYSVFGHITVVFFEKTDLFLWPYQSMASRFSLNTGNPGKDTLGYMMVQCQKTEWVSIASGLVGGIGRRGGMGGIGRRGGRGETYVWLDFGIFHMFHGKIDVFQTEMYRLRGRIKRKGVDGKITAARCWDPARMAVGDIYKDVCWLFAGSVFGGREDAIQRFARLMREKCFCLLREKNSLMWEINVWALIYREVPELFALYPSDHSEIIVRGWT